MQNDTNNIDKANNDTDEIKLGASAIVRSGDKFLLIERGKEPSKGMYAFAGGRVEPNETLADAAVRELAEETGLIGKNPTEFAQYRLGSAEHSFQLHVFKVDVENTEGAKAGDDAAALGWFTFEEALELPLTPNVSECLVRLSNGE